MSIFIRLQTFLISSKQTLWGPLLLLGLPVILCAQEIDESALFGDPNALMVDSTSYQEQVAALPTDSASGLKSSGELVVQQSATLDREGVRHLFTSQRTAPKTQSQAIGTIYLDARNNNGTKAFAAIEGDYLADSSHSQAYLRELFLDFTMRQRLYVRVGKQVLQWGRCYFWNPSDLVNVEHKAFVQRNGSLEGTYGIRLHAPFGTRANLYGFLGSDNAKTTNELKGAAKAEVLLGGTETALGIWKRKGLDPVYSWDISSAISSWNLAGELAVLPKGFSVHYDRHGDTLWTNPSKAFTPQAAVSFGRSFDFMQIQDRIMIQYEMYYNGLGYTHNPLEDSRNYVWKTPVTVSELQFAQLGVTMPSTRITNGPKSLWLFANNAYQSYTLGRYYAAFFTSFSRFLIQDLTLSCNGLMNLVDGSYIISGALDESTLDNLTLQIMAITMGGTSPGEMTFWGDRLTIRASASYKF